MADRIWSMARGEGGGKTAHLSLSLCHRPSVIFHQPSPLLLRRPQRRPLRAARARAGGGGRQRVRGPDARGELLQQRLAAIATSSESRAIRLRKTA